MPVKALALTILSLVSALSYNNSDDYNSGTLGQFPSQVYQSSNITPPAWNWNKYPDSTPLPGYILSGPRGGGTVPDDQQGPMMFDWNGELVWSGADDVGQTMSYNAFTYNGSSVIGVWQGAFNGGGYGNGVGLVLDNTYKVIATVNSSFASSVDFHEFAITPNGTALITSYGKLAYDLSAYGVQTDDPSGGYLLQGLFEEVDIATGQILFNWSSIDHVNPNMSYADPGSTGTDLNNAWDYFHINSIDKDNEGQYLISSRHCHTIYQIDKTDGHVIWEMNGKNSTWNMGNGTTFEWQHHARWESNYQQISLFDNAASDFAQDEAQARGMLLNLDMESMSTSLALEVFPYNHTTSPSQGSFTLQPNGNWLAGWGSEPYISEYDPSGTMLWSVQFGIGSAQSYRAFRANWTAFPTTSPNISVSMNSTTNVYDVYTSWNGATEVKLWHLYHGATDDGRNLAWVQSANRTGFETYLSVPASSIDTNDYLQVVAADTGNKTLGYSDFIAANGSTRSPAVAAQSSAVASQSPSQSSSLTPVETSGAASPSFTLDVAYTMVIGALVLLLGSSLGAFAVV